MDREVRESEVYNDILACLGGDNLVDEVEKLDVNLTGAELDKFRVLTHIWLSAVWKTAMAQQLGRA